MPCATGTVIRGITGHPSPAAVTTSMTSPKVRMNSTQVGGGHAEGDMGIDTYLKMELIQVSCPDFVTCSTAWRPGNEANYNPGVLT